MSVDEGFINVARLLFETSTGWGDSATWTNQDFLNLSGKIQQKTGVALSHVTLKRLWGKVKYDSLPNTHTLDTLARYLDYENWRQFKAKNCSTVLLPDKTPDGLKQIQKNTSTSLFYKRRYYWAILILVFVTVAAGLSLPFTAKRKLKINDRDYKFSSKTIISSGLPNSVVFNYDASRSPFDSVIIQQSWDRKLQTRVSKYQHQHTSIYYYPDYYKAKLIVGRQIVISHRLLIRTDGWLPMVIQSPVPAYYDKKDVMINGRMTLPMKKITERNIQMQPVTPTVLFANVKDFGDIYSNDFEFEASLKNDYKMGAAVCQSTTIYLLCEGTAIEIPLSVKGCISNLNLMFTNFYAKGKLEDLSAFGVDFDNFVDVKILAVNGRANIYIDKQLVYTINHNIIRKKIVGIEFAFQGTGSVDFVKLKNSKMVFVDNF